NDAVHLHAVGVEPFKAIDKTLEGAGAVLEFDLHLEQSAGSQGGIDADDSHMLAETMISNGAHVGNHIALAFLVCIFDGIDGGTTGQPGDEAAEGEEMKCFHFRNNG